MDHVLNGSVRTVGDRVRITAQLIDGEDGQWIWSETFDRRLEDVFAIQEEIAQVIVSRLQVTLSDVENGVLIDVAAAPPTINTYKTYLRGVEAYRNRNVFGNDGASALLERAAAGSPTLVPAQLPLVISAIMTPQKTAGGLQFI